MTREEIFARLYSTAEVYPPPLEQHSALHSSIPKTVKAKPQIRLGFYHCLAECGI